MWQASACYQLRTLHFASPLFHIQGVTRMSTTAPTETSSTKAGSTKSAAGGTLNKYEEVRLARKKQRRKAHRKTIKRSNTNG
jgi:hypothetical protein